MEENKSKKNIKKEPTQEELEFGIRLAKIREKRKLSQKKATEKMNELAKKENLAKLGTNTLRTYEAGRFPKLDKLQTIKAYYNVTYDYLFGVTEDENYDTDEQAMKNKEAIKNIKKILNNL